MRLGGRLQAAIEILGDMDKRECPAAESLKDWGQSHRFAGSSDRAAIGNIVYDALRRRASISWRMESEAVADIAYGALLGDGGLTLEELAAMLAGDRFAPPPLAPSLVAAWQSRKLADAPDVIQADLPQWCVSQFEQLLGTGWAAEGQALGRRPPLDLRANTLRSTPEEVVKAMAGTQAEAVSWFPQAVRIAPVAGLGRHPKVQMEAAFQNGWFEVQDLGSQIVARLCGARAGMQVLDYCAGAGGKTLALAADMENRGQIHACDAANTRLAPIFERLRRAGVHNAQVHTEKTELAALNGRMDLVVVDAPCTGSGTWRRHPDTKWRLTGSQLQHRVAEQQNVLAAAAPFVKTGGRLVYITCSLFYDEDDGQIAHFLARQSGFRLCDMAAIWQAAITQAAAPAPRFTLSGLVLSPHISESDGFYIAVMEKTA
ncbi:MAG: SUN-family protein [Candidatus Tokpelaia hoelldobleri]|uniref:SUN-family protein n=1 Tax=Candidatus Tokpelaia hoelldobleri TaxID=1902579 RepID=A0A1U9JW15_9HYPH|nr:MAG: SUN-family protein [Candidatus Tokpelaia hoelldoblerii]